MLGGATTGGVTCSSSATATNLTASTRRLGQLLTDAFCRLVADAGSSCCVKADEQWPLAARSPDGDGLHNRGAHLILTAGLGRSRRDDRPGTGRGELQERQIGGRDCSRQTGFGDELLVRQMSHLEVLERLLGRPLDHVERHDDVGPPADERLQKRHLDAARLWGTGLIVQEDDVGARDVGGHRVEADEGPACRGKNPLRSQRPPGR